MTSVRILDKCSQRPYSILAELANRNTRHRKSVPVGEQAGEFGIAGDIEPCSRKWSDNVEAKTESRQL
jgi:hypothetical protein